jgi:replicative DNA helicase
MNHLEAEQWVIGGLLINPENIDRVRGLVSAEDFINPSHLKIFSVIEELSDREDIPLDLSIIYSVLKETEGDEVKIAKFLENDIPTDVALPYWAKVVRKQSLERKLKELTSEENINLSAAETIIHELGNLDKEAPLYRPISKIPALSTEPKSQIETGFIDLDRHLRFGRGNLLGIAGRTGEGKTSLGLGIAHHVSREKAVGVISLEMTGEEVRERIHNSFGHLPENFLVADPPALSTMDLKHICKTMKDEQGIELILVDYIQLMREREDFRARHLEVSHIIRRIKEIAKELQIAIIAISQLSRSIDYRGSGSLPSLSDLKESGDIEYACNSILFLHQPQKGDEDYRGENIKLLILAKNRWGRKGKIKVYWNEKKTKFGNYQEGAIDDVE